MYQSRCPNLVGLHFSVVEIQTIILLSYLDVQILMAGNHRVLELKRSGVGQTHPQFFDMLLSIKNEVENLSSVLLSHRGFAEYPAEKI